MHVGWEKYCLRELTDIEKRIRRHVLVEDVPTERIACFLVNRLPDGRLVLGDILPEQQIAHLIQIFASERELLASGIT